MPSIIATLIHCQYFLHFFFLILIYFFHLHFSLGLHSNFFNDTSVDSWKPCCSGPIEGQAKILIFAYKVGILQRMPTRQEILQLIT